MLQRLIFLLLVIYASATHYRGGSITWDIRESDYINGSSTVSVRLYQRHSWRRSAAPSFWNTPMCDWDTKANKTALLGDGALICSSTSCNTVPYVYQSISTQVLCTDFSVDYDSASGEKYTTLQLPINQRLIFKYASCCWIGLLPYNYEPDWALTLIIDTNRRVDGKFNSAPKSTMVPVYKVEIGGTYTIDIPMADIDGDQLRCRWGTNSSESGGIYTPKGQLQSAPCQLTYNATNIGYEGIALVIEDFDTNNRVLSSIPLQFLIQIVPVQPVITIPPVTIDVTGTASPPVLPLLPCPYVPEYVGDLASGACIGIASNNMTEIRIVTKIPCNNSSTSIKDIDTISPTGMIKGPITQDPQNNNTYIMKLQWTPQANQYGIHQLCVTPVDNSTRSGQTACFNILVDVHSPQFVENSMLPTGVVSQTQSTWTIATDVNIIPPINPIVSAVFYKRNQAEAGIDIEVTRVNMSTAYYQARQISFNTHDTVWEQGQDYYILLDGGVATINQSCGVQSSPIIDTHFWTFSIAADPTTAEVIIDTSTETTTTVPKIATTAEDAIIITVPTTTTTTTTAAAEDTTAEDVIDTTVPTTTTTTTAAKDTTAEDVIDTTVPTTTTTAKDTTAEDTISTTFATTTTTPVVTTTTTTTTTTSVVTTTTSVQTTTTTSKKIKTTTTSTTMTTTTTTITTTTTAPSNLICSEWLLFGTIKNVTTNANQPNYTFCFYVNTTTADVTIAANTWAPCATWKTSGAADPLMNLYNITNNPKLLAQNDDGNSIFAFNCYASVISYRLCRGNYQVVIRHQKCNYGRFEVRLSAETTNRLK